MRRPLPLCLRRRLAFRGHGRARTPSCRRHFAARECRTKRAALRGWGRPQVRVRRRGIHSPVAGHTVERPIGGVPAPVAAARERTRPTTVNRARRPDSREWGGFRARQSIRRADAIPHVPGRAWRHVRLHCRHGVTETTKEEWA